MAIKSVKEMVKAAKAEIKQVSVDEAQKRNGDGDFLLVDIRDVRELDRDGRVPNAFHAPRGMLEFWIDDESPYYKAEQFGTGKKIVFHCNKGWRSALATETAQTMGLENCCHIAGGFTAWAETDAPVEKGD